MNAARLTAIAKTSVAWLGVVCAFGVLCGTAFAQFQMPDPKQMAGIPRPVDDLPNGSVSVRLIRGQLTNNITNHPVEMHVGDKVLTVKTDDAGRAQFDKLPAGATLKAVAVVDGERLESQEFPAPGQGGIRLMLVATDTSKGPAAAATPAVTGQVSLGGQSRIILEPGDEVVALYYLLGITNGSGTPVNPATPFLFNMPPGATGTTLLEGSSPLASTSGLHVTVHGPFPPGTTLVQVACDLPVDSDTLTIRQTFPAALDRLAVLVKKVGDLKLNSTQLERQQDFPSDGQVIIGATGGAVAAGEPVELSLTGLPHHSAVPRWTALMLALGIAIVGVWFATRPEDKSARAAERRKLASRREKLLADLVRLEHDHRNGRGDSTRYAARREELVAALEQVYGTLDDPDDHAGVAA